MATRTKPPQIPSPSALQEDTAQYAPDPLTLSDLDTKFPNRPKNHSKTPPFSDLFLSVFNPLIECKPSSSTSAKPSRRVAGFRGNAPSKLSYHEQRRHIIERFMSRWRNDVGNDFYPALRLILPDKDRDRGVYGLKESTLGKLLVKVMKIDRNSADGYALMHWKLPGQGGGDKGTAGDFAGRCFEVLSKRQMRNTPGEMTIAEVNVELDRLAGAIGEGEQLPIWEGFYQRMNAEEMMWLVRIVMKDMRVGATERTFLGLWHPDAEDLFSVSSSLRRVCWELWDPEVRIAGEKSGVTLMSCFQPQLAQFQMTSGFGKLVASLGVREEDGEFWIEEKLDGERMQMHMEEDGGVAGEYKFAWWSRKAKDYTYLYGSGLKDDNSALTRHLGGAFHEGVRDLILDGEMITWDPEIDKIVPFGTLKTAALDQQKNPFQNGPRPLYRVFDILLLNGKKLGNYPLSERHKALEAAVKGVPRRLEIHPYESVTSADAIEPMLRKVVAEASEGLVLKNPRSLYQLNSRNNDWIKVKPEYMSEFGESLDCVVIGGYYGSGRRGGTISSFLCGLRIGQNFIKAGGVNKEKCLSFCKVGGGLKAEDYAEIKHHTEGKWRDWDSNNPPSEYVELGGGERLQYEKPDVWIRPSESVVISIKAASFGPSDQFAMGWTLRFPRFRKLRLDKSWDSGLDMDEFESLRGKANQEEQERKAMEMENRRRKPATKRAKQDLVIVGTNKVKKEEDADDIKPKLDDLPPPPGNNKPRGKKIFQGLHFCVLSESLKPIKMSKPDIEKLIKENGGRIHQQIGSPTPPTPAARRGGRRTRAATSPPPTDTNTTSTGPTILPISDKNVVKVASLKKKGQTPCIIKPKWIFDCLAQDAPTKGGFLLPFEQSHLFHATEDVKAQAEETTDKYGDSYTRDVTDIDELRFILDNMDVSDGDDDDNRDFDVEQFLDQLQEHGQELEGLKSFLFMRCNVFFAVVADDDSGEGNSRAARLRNYVKFGGGVVVGDIDDADTNTGVTHIVVVSTNGGGTSCVEERELAAEMRHKISNWEGGVPRIVGQKWVEDCWKEGTLVDEEVYSVGGLN